MPSAANADPEGSRASAPVVIAVDGPAAAGKGTLARRLAEHYGFAYLDTGALYRGAAAMLLAEGGDPAHRAAARRAAENFDMDRIADLDLRSPAVSAAASVIAAQPDVRAALLAYQRAFAARPPGGAAGAVLDGRDIGTVVCPDAPVKLFVTASPEIRARRRWLELQEQDPDVSYEKVLEEVKARDARDRSRADAPLRPAADAQLLDTSELSIDAAFEAARRIVDRTLSSARPS